MEQELSKPKWEAKVSERLANASADQIWPFLQDFFELYKIFPGLAISYGIHGRNGEVGSIRYCEGFSIPSQDMSQEIKRLVSWSKEKIIAVDDAEKSLSYEIVDCNIGFKSYVSTIKIVPRSGVDDHGGCLIEWSFSVDPVEGLRLEDLVKKYELGLKGMVEKMEGALRNI